jgi:gluconokinase
MNLLCFDIATGGISAALFDANLDVTRFAETQWTLQTDDQGAATVSISTVEAQFKRLIQQLNLKRDAAITAICMDCFMHNCVVLDDADQPLTPVFTWLDQRGEAGIDVVRGRVGNRFHELTGCHYHPMFPIFKLAAMRIEGLRRVASVKAALLHRLTGRWVEDHGMASASGLFNIREGDWDPQLLGIVGLNSDNLPSLVSRTEIIGNLTPSAALQFALPYGIPVVNGSGDGFLANVGSECESPPKISVTLGTSAVVRQTLASPALDASSGTFCYRVDASSYLLGCAGSNGGNVLDWGRDVFGTLQNANESVDPPIFIPLLHGERSPDWNPQLTASWHGLKARHTAADLSRSILEGVIFNLAHFIDIVQSGSGEKASDLVLSGNGFLQPMTAPILAAVVGLPVWMPSVPGLASLRGAAICALRALGISFPRLSLSRVSPLADPNIVRRYEEYRSIRGRIQV